ncbi:hypothetical protein CTEN210_06978 [Chaetoceros tenuissimus]|uniref:Uncharacterized protein n=1 Tax=Chaetoceros tenuissimus TaxID=426638 RepID=A0AAD3CQV5_9STRA|nr:hypothetical protein CTEN210_06978 [Chaetoceros tenuissimus]
MQRLQVKPDLTDQDFDDGRALIGNARKQFSSYTEAVARKMCQRVALNQLIELMIVTCEALQEDCPLGKLFIDWSNKFLEYCNRESQIDFYGKCGLSNQISSLLFCIWDRIMKKAVLKTVHFNQIMEGSNKQDASIVFSFLEASLVHVIRAFPKIKEIVIQSDNAICYQNTALVTAVPMLNAKLMDEIFVKKIIFTETQDGRGPPDVHGAEQKNCLKRGLKKTDDQNKMVRIKTARELALALTYKGGAKNTIVQLLDVDFQRMGNIMKFIEPTTKEIKKYVTRKNEI